MSGICGFIGARDEALIDRMLDRMKWRGGFPLKFYRGGDFGLGVCQDAPPQGNPSTPLLAFNENKSVCVVCDGHISDEADIRDRLSAAGHAFKTDSPAETIAHAYEEHGLGFLDVFQGVFAFALWDESEFLLVLGRDRFGVRPLCFSVSQDKLLFASSSAALRACDPEHARLDARSLDARVAFGYVPGERTMFENITRLAPGHLMICRRGAVRVSKYWEPAPETDSDAEPDWLENAVEKLGGSFSPQKSDGAAPPVCIIEPPYGSSPNPAAALTLALAGGHVDIIEPDPASVAFFESPLSPGAPDFSRIPSLLRIMDAPPSDFSFLLLDTAISSSAAAGSRILSAAGLSEALEAAAIFSFIASIKSVAGIRPQWARAATAAFFRRAPRFMPGLNSLPVSGIRVAAALSGCGNVPDIFDALFCVIPSNIREELYSAQVSTALSGFLASHSSVMANNSQAGSSRATASVAAFLFDTLMPSCVLPRLDAVSALNRTRVEFPFLNENIIRSVPRGREGARGLRDIADSYALETRDGKKARRFRARRVPSEVISFIEQYLTEERTRARGFFKWEQTLALKNAADKAPAVSLALLEAWCDCHARGSVR
ncbi:MAG TPA: hypothetical protein PLS19_12720 [bacterium]|nr:hypothetical protein [bacterium]